MEWRLCLDANNGFSFIRVNFLGPIGEGERWQNLVLPVITGRCSPQKPICRLLCKGLHKPHWWQKLSNWLGCHTCKNWRLIYAWLLAIAQWDLPGSHIRGDVVAARLHRVHWLRSWSITAILAKAVVDPAVVRPADFQGLAAGTAHCVTVMLTNDLCCLVLGIGI